MSSKKRAAIYARVSTEMQVDNTSLPEQREVCEAAIRMRGWELVDSYVDEGLSGKDDTRPAWRQMLQDARDGKIDAVVVAKLDRFARKAGDAIRETDRLSDMGVDLVVVKEQIDMSTPAGRAMRTMLAGFAEFEADTIVARTTAGQRAKGRAGGWVGSKPPFGWRLEGTKRDARPVPDEREREVLRAMHRLFVKERLTTGEVADRLNEAGLRPRLAAAWSYQTVRQVVRNATLWTGETEWGAVTGQSHRPHAHSTKVNRDGTAKWGETVKIDLGDPVFTRQEWQALQRAVNRKSSGSPSAPQRQMLTGRLFGSCEFDQHYDGVTTKSRPHPFYKCAGRRYRSAETPRCSCPQLRGPEVDEAVWRELSSVLANPDRLELLAKQWLELDDDADLAGDEPMIAALRKQENTLERAIGRARDLYLMADDPAEALQTMERLKADLADVRGRLEAMTAVAERRVDQARRITDVAALAERARGRLENAPLALRREVVELLDVRVMVSDVVRGVPQTMTIHGVLDPSMFLPDEKPAEQGRSSRSSSCCCR
ncbi:recombinase family protein [Microbacterium sp. MM2322]|uniref:recombinase family protein n=1 Tax=Microbacterium sp. MM2322 TaxID=3157631 RepID=UPI0032D56A48